MANPATIPPFHAALLGEAEFLRDYGHLSYELIDGVPREVSMPGFEHGEIIVRFILELGIYLRATSNGRIVSNDTLVRISTNPLTLLGPDIAYFSYERLPKSERPKGASPVVPELAVEAKSPSDAWGEVLAKVSRYLDAGVTAVAVIDADTQSVAVYRAGMVQEVFGVGDELTLPDILPGFGVVVGKLFE